MEAAVFIGYLLVFCWLIQRIPFFKKTNLSPFILIGLFLLKVLAGIAYAKFYALPQYFENADTWNYYKWSLTETDWLLRDPIAFVQDLFQYGYKQSGNLFVDKVSYWNDLKSNSIIKLIAVVNVFTGKSYYTNIIFFNFLYFFGPAALFRLAKKYWQYNNRWLIIPVFLLPSFVFWCSGIHKDGLIFTAIMLAVYSLHKLLSGKRRMLLYILIIAFCFLVMFALRNFILLLILPAMAAWMLSIKLQRPRLIFTSIYALCGILFFTVKYIHPALDFPQYLVNKQIDFNNLPGASKIELPNLEPTFFSFVKYFPHALDIAFLQPHITEINNFSYVPAIIENVAIVVFIIVCLFYQKKNSQNPILLFFFLYFSLSILFLSGYTITFSGAIVRYKSIALPLLLTALVLITNWHKMKTDFEKIIKLRK